MNIAMCCIVLILVLCIGGTVGRESSGAGLHRERCRFDVRFVHKGSCDQGNSENVTSLENGIAALEGMFRGLLKTVYEKGFENGQLESRVTALEKTVQNITNSIENQHVSLRGKLDDLEHSVNESEMLVRGAEESLSKMLLQNKHLLDELKTTQQDTLSRDADLEIARESLSAAKEEMNRCVNELALSKENQVQKDCPTDLKLQWAFGKIWYAKSCQDWFEMSATENGEYQVDPDGPGMGLDPFDVYCDFHARNNTAIATIFHHNVEKRTKVEPECEVRKCYKKEISYRQDIRQIAAAMKLTAVCEQFIKYECYNSQLLLSYPDTALAAWYSRDGDEMLYWGGASQGSNMCGCGATGTCDVDTSWATGRCNCDNNDKVWREDSGYLTDKCTLPVTKLAFGDASSGEEGFHTLGPLVCYNYNYRNEPE